jgi:hypothetical protein
MSSAADFPETSMAPVKVKCSACGAPVGVLADGVFAGAEVVSALCPACMDQQFREQGGAVVALRGEPEGALFPLGKITITVGAVEALEASSQHAAEFLARHARGDWGKFGVCDAIRLTADEARRGWEATDDPGKVNKSNLRNRRDRVMSEHTTSRGKRLWVVTYLDGGGGTTVLLPEEY